MTIGEKIKFYRMKNKLTQKELAKYCNISEISIRKYESNERKPKIKTMQKIARALNVDPAELDNSLSELYDNLDSLKKNLLNELNKIPSQDWFGDEWHSINNNYMEEKKNLQNKINYLENKISKQDYETYGEKVKRLRIENGFDLKNFSDKTKIPIQLLKRIESNSRTLNMDTLYRIAKCLNIPTVDIAPNVIFNWFDASNTEQDILYEELLNSYEKLDEEGQKKVVEYAEMLSKIPEYLAEDK